MRQKRKRGGAVNTLYVLVGGAVLVLAALGTLLFDMSNPATISSDSRVTLYCAAGLRTPVEKIAADYEREYGVSVQIQFGGSNTLLSQIDVARVGDLYLAADEVYIERGREKGLVAEVFPVAVQHPVIAVAPGNPKNIRGIDDLLRDDVKTAIGNPDQAAVGKIARMLLEKSGHWKQLEEHVTDTGVFKPTVPEIANDVKIRSIDAGIVWDTTVAAYSGIEAVRAPELDAGTAHVTLGVLNSSTRPTAALRFARYLAASDRGLVRFKEAGFTPVDGDKWAEVPKLTFFCGAVNRRAVESVVQEFQEREGVSVTTSYDGCGILVGQMRILRDQQQASGFPDTYMACDVYYLKAVEDWFQDAVNVSDTEVVIAVPKGNPKNIRSLKDLTKPGMRVLVGQSEQCTIGVLTRQLLESEGLYDAVMENVVAQMPTSATLVPNVTTGNADAALAYATDTLAERDKLDVIRVDSSAAQAVQPFSIARSSENKQLSKRLFKAIADSRERFESAGFHWRLDQPDAEPADDHDSRE